MKFKLADVMLLLLTLASCTPMSEWTTTVSHPTDIGQVMPSRHELRLTKYPGNFTCFKLETATGVTIVTDPFAMNEDIQADIVTVSHYDADHASFSRLKEGYHLIDTAQTFTEKGITITGVAGHHNKGNTKTTNIIYVFDIEGLRLAQFASQGELPTASMFAQMGKVDILIIQIYGAGNGKLSVAEAGQIVRQLQAKIVIPAHTDVSKNDELASLLGTKSEPIQTGQLTVTADDLKERQTPRVIVLDTP